MLFLILAGCATPSPPSEMPIRIPAGGGFNDTEVSMPNDVAGWMRTGSINGMAYEYFLDYSGSVTGTSLDYGPHRWFVQCETDRITDEKSCEIFSIQAELVILFNGSRSAPFICALNHDFPGRNAAVRVDKQRPVQIKDGRCVRSAALFEALLKGDKVVVRQVKWPRDYPSDTEVSLAGLPEAYQLSKYLYSRL